MPDTLKNTSFFAVKIKYLLGSIVAVSGLKVTNGGYTFNGGVRIVDAANPSAPVLYGEALAKTNLGFHGMALVKGRYLYVACGQAGIQIIDLIDFRNPRMLQGFYDVPGPGWCWDVFVQGDLVYVADAQTGIKILNVADPLHPEYLGGIDTPMNAREIIVRDEVAYVADYNGLSVIDVSDPMGPRIMGGFPGLAMGVKIQGNFAFIAASPKGLVIVDISDPSNPKEVSRLPNESDRATTVRLDVSDEHVILANGQDGFMVIDISELGNPRHIGHEPVQQGAAYDVTIMGDWCLGAVTGPTIHCAKFR